MIITNTRNEVLNFDGKSERELFYKYNGTGYSGFPTDSFYLQVSGLNPFLLFSVKSKFTEDIEGHPWKTWDGYYRKKPNLKQKIKRWFSDEKEFDRENLEIIGKSEWREFYDWWNDNISDFARDFFRDFDCFLSEKKTIDRGFSVITYLENLFFKEYKEYESVLSNIF